MTEDLFLRLARSKFRSRFRLAPKDKQYVEEKGMDALAAHASDFIASRLAAAEPKNDGKQTPMRGHPVFLAQHATACCCRGCLEKWHAIPKGRALSEQEQAYIAGVLLHWIELQMQPAMNSAGNSFTDTLTEPMAEPTTSPTPSPRTDRSKPPATQQYGLF